MKNYYRALIACLFLLLPLTAVAAPVFFGTGTIDVTSSAPIEDDWYLDYDGSGTINPQAGSTIIFTNAELFCVSGVLLNTTYKNYDFYKFEDADLTDFAKATWIADNYMSYQTGSQTQDFVKGEAQKAIWKILGVMDILHGSGLDKNIYDDALSHGNYVTSSWLWAQSLNDKSQDFLVPYEYPSGGDLPEVPEPGTLLLLGLGLTGVAVYKKFRN